MVKRIREWFTYHSVYSHILAPIWLRIPEKHRWAIVDRLNKSQDRCWCNLVDDALAVPEVDACDVSVPNLPPKQRPHCSTTCDWFHPEHSGQHECGCYCGKFRFIAPDGPRDRKKVA